MGVVRQERDLDMFGVAKLIRALMNPVSADPGSPNDGELWYNSTSQTFKVRKGGATDTIAMMSDVTAGGLSSALFDAQSLLIAVTDNTPVALSLSASQIVGRRATGDIGAISYANLKTDLAITAADVGLGSAWNGDARPRSTHSGTQLSSTISDFATAADARADARIAAWVGAAPTALDTLVEIAARIEAESTEGDALVAAVALRTRKFAANIGDGSAVTIVVPDNLGTTDKVPVAKYVATGAIVDCVIETTDANNTTYKFLQAPTLNSVRAVIVG